MITGSINLNNLTEHQFNRVSVMHEPRAASVGFDPTNAQRNVNLFSHVTLTFSNESGMNAAMEICATLYQVEAATGT